MNRLLLFSIIIVALPFLKILFHQRKAIFNSFKKKKHVPDFGSSKSQEARQATLTIKELKNSMTFLYYTSIRRKDYSRNLQA